jgi:hypothetical protein
MGSISAMGSINRVIEAHGPELVAEVTAALPSALRAMAPRVVLENRTYEIGVVVQFDGPSGDPESLELSGYDIDGIAERFPDCEVGY